MPRLKALLIAIALVTPSLRVRADEWLEFRGVGGASRVQEGSLPVELSAADIRWSVDLPGRGLSGVLVVGDRAFVTTSEGPTQDRLHLDGKDPLGPAGVGDRADDVPPQDERRRADAVQ